MGERDGRHSDTSDHAADHEAALYERVARIDDALQLPMALLGLVWLGLLIAEFAYGVSGWLEWSSYAIWGVFIAEFAIRFAFAPRKAEFLRDNWFTLISLMLPALRVFSAFRALRAFSAARGLRLARVVATLSKAKGGLASLMRQHGLQYVLALTVLIAFGGAAGMYAFEKGSGTDGLHSYGDALWWTAMLLTTIASQYWPKTTEGRILALLLSGYALGVLGFITAALSSFLVGRDMEKEHARPRESGIDGLRAEVARLSAQIERLAQRGDAPPLPPGAKKSRGFPPRGRGRR